MSQSRLHSTPQTMTPPSELPKPEMPLARFFCRPYAGWCRFSGRNGLFKIQKQFLGLQIDDKIVNGVFPEINQLLKNIFGAGHVFSPRNLKTVFLFYQVYMMNLNFVIMLFQFGQQAFNQFLGS